MSLYIYNSLSRSKELFTPTQANHVRMYVCGMTVYDFCHLGHARVLVAFDIVQRWLKCKGWRVSYVRNITDIDDKIIRKALAEKVSVRTITESYIHAMHADSARLGVEAPTHEPRATDYIPEMLRIIDRLVEREHAYQAENGDINYAVRSFPHYGKLSGKSLDELRAGERVAVEQSKRDALDFVLWKSAKAEEPDDVKWPSKYGLGRPGWHIECSAMSSALLGDTFDIHGGGNDLQFPHHENEIAQSEGATAQPLARFWMHNGFVRLNEEKMSKSLGNVFLLRDLLQRFAPETLRFFLAKVHYRSALNFSDEEVVQAHQALTRLYTTLSKFPELDGLVNMHQSIDWQHPFAQRFAEAMDDDFNTPQALAVLFELANQINRTSDITSARLLKSLAAGLGFLQQPATAFLQSGADALLQPYIETQISHRQVAKAERNFVLADAIRSELLAQGIVLEDGASGTTWRKLS